MTHWNRLFGSTILAAALFAGTAASAADITLRYNAPAPDGGVHGTGMHAFKECVETGTNGKVEVPLFFSAALGNQEDGIEALKLGTLDMMQIDTAITTIDDLLSVLALPYIFRDRDHVAKVMSGEVGDLVRDRLVAQGVRPLGYWEGGFRHITNNVRPINTPADLKGIKMRTPSSEIRIKIFNHYGANASALPYAEVYSALQLGTYDGQENPVEAVEASKFYEVQKYLSFTGHVYTVSYPLISEVVYQKLPADVQTVLNQCGVDATKATVDFSIEADQRVVDLAKSKGMEVNQADVNAFVEASQPIWGDLTGNDPEAKALADKIASM
jgi:TRAP-type transport system periplasmic protein